MRSTREHILDTAERMFADQGYSGTSVRAIIAKAQVNLAAVHYHFRSKEALLEAVILRRAEPANQERLALLDACERAANGDRPTVEAVIKAFLQPAFAARDREREGDVFRHLIGRLQAEGDLWPRIVAAHFSPVLERFGAALRRALPDLPPEEFFWRVHFALGATTQALRGAQGLELMSDGLCRGSDPQDTLERLVRFVSAGLRAPVTDCCSAGGTK